MKKINKGNEGNNAKGHSDRYKQLAWRVAALLKKTLKVFKVTKYWQIDKEEILSVYAHPRPQGTRSGGGGTERVLAHLKLKLIPSLTVFALV